MKSKQGHDISSDQRICPQMFVEYTPYDVTLSSLGDKRINKM